MTPRFNFSMLLLAVAMLGSNGCQKPETPAPKPVDQSEPQQAQSKLPTIELWLGPEKLTAEMALTPEQERTGMMFRTNMAEGDGMIFVLPPQRASFWMKNCPLPLSVAYIDPEGVILEIHDLKAQDTNSVVSASENIEYALETPQGWFQRHQVREGMTVRSERGTLLDTFHRRRPRSGL